MTHFEMEWEGEVEERATDDQATWFLMPVLYIIKIIAAKKCATLPRDGTSLGPQSLQT